MNKNDCYYPQMNKNNEYNYHFYSFIVLSSSV